MKNQRTHVVLIAILASLLSYSIAVACSPVTPRILVKCSNLEVSIEGGSQPVTGDTYESILKKRVNATINNLWAVVPECEEDLIPVLPTFEQEIIKWLDYRNNKRGVLDGDLVLEPYSTRRDAELQQKKNNLLSCSYEEYQHFGEWLIVFETSRPYCYDFWYAPGACPSIILSLGHFLFYLVANFNLNALPYLLGLLSAGAALFYLVWRVLKNRPNLQAWKISVLSVVILAVELFLLVMPFWVIGQIVGWILVFYIAILWYKRLKNKEYVFGQKAGQHSVQPLDLLIYKKQYPRTVDFACLASKS